MQYSSPRVFEVIYVDSTTTRLMCASMCRCMYVRYEVMRICYVLFLVNGEGETGCTLLSPGLEYIWDLRVFNSNIYVHLDYIDILCIQMEWARA